MRKKSASLRDMVKASPVMHAGGYAVRLVSSGENDLQSAGMS